MSETRRIGDQDYARRKAVRSVQVELEAIQDRIGDVVDQLGGIQVEMEHAGNQLNALAAGEGPFDEGRRAELMDARRDLRARVRAVNTELLKLQAQAVSTRLEPQPGADVLLEAIDQDEFAGIVEWLDAPPTEPSATGSGTS